VRALQRQGLRPKTQVRLATGRGEITSDIVLTRSRIAIFVDGCFWHACPRHATWPKHRATWWRAKLETNVRRDVRQRRRLREAGWHVFRVWTHELPEQAASRVIRAVSTIRHRRL
jgi:DNA mismatch endonuclease (patch repair protein)